MRSSLGDAAHAIVPFARAGNERGVRRSQRLRSLSRRIRIARGTHRSSRNLKGRRRPNTDDDRQHGRWRTTSKCGPTVREPKFQSKHGPFRPPRGDAPQQVQSPACRWSVPRRSLRRGKAAGERFRTQSSTSRRARAATSSTRASTLAPRRPADRPSARDVRSAERLQGPPRLFDHGLSPKSANQDWPHGRRRRFRQIPVYQAHPFWMLPFLPPSSNLSATTMRRRYFMLL